MYIKITKKKLVTTAAAVIITMTPFVAVAPAYAATNTNSAGTFFSGLIQYIAQKFGLDESKVQAAVNEYKTQHQAQMQQNMQNREKTRLDSLVQQGKITSSQEQAIITELNKLHSEYNPANFKNMTPQERQQQFQKEKDELTSWAQSQGIDVSLIMPMSGIRMRGHFRHHLGGQNTTPQPTPTVSG